MVMTKTKAGPIEVLNKSICWSPCDILALDLKEEMPSESGMHRPMITSQR